ncbi:glycosyltransferase family 9 protein [Prodigiosinella confusarubida]|uniref:Glycosyltransferase family 9 protein n=1 Tax=Serratia sp. (strain ATCC 39006) TaxID=104623 RepID=A0A2I5T299_SERS3|nr:glycosyltransferase family 9 protein [Serratia sp. ATCC 39006]AUG98671.1 glycosyltransferase family 9 protein [Serratia sp. ATCC 39006]AUH02986.1 glycosyltransferase family 9 protein [Serratia sp. ATCC 39006]
MSKFSARLRIFPRGLLQLLKKPWRRPPTHVRSILVAHNLLLGDTVMLTPLLSKLRQNYPDARIVLLCKLPFMEVYQLNPYRIEVQVYDPALADSVSKIIQSGPYDLAIIPGDNRYSWLALAAGSRWIVAHSPAKRNAKSWPVNEAHPYPITPMAWSDAVAGLTEGVMPIPSSWPIPETDFPIPTIPYVVLHVGASNPTRFWPPERWMALAGWLVEQGYLPVWSGGKNEQHIVNTIDPDDRYTNYVGQLSLSQLLALLANSHGLICADTGVAHVAKWVNTPTLTLYGPGNPIAFGPGVFWQRNIIIATGFNPIACRDQKTLFARPLPWLERCNRSDNTCKNFQDGYSACMKNISLNDVQTAFINLLRKN